jgi:hypothetical protein
MTLYEQGRQRLVEMGSPSQTPKLKSWRGTKVVKPVMELTAPSPAAQFFAAERAP